MAIDRGGSRAKGQYNSATNEIWINKDHPDHKDDNGNWTDDAKITIFHEAVHVALDVGTFPNVHGLVSQAHKLEKSDDPDKRAWGSALMTAAVAACYGGGQL